MTADTPIPAEALAAADRAAEASYRRWADTPNRAAYVYMEMGRAARSAAEAAAPILAAAARTAAAPTAADPSRDWGRPEPADLDAIENFWLSMCPNHDIGEPERGCNCPQGDYRQVISDLVDEVRALRGDVVEGERRGRTAAAADPLAAEVLHAAEKWRDRWFAVAVPVPDPDTVSADLITAIDAFRAARIAEDGANRA